MILHFRARHLTARHFKALSGGVAVSEVALLAEDVTSASSVSQPLLGVISLGSLFAEDVTSASSVTTPALGQGHVLDAIDVASASSVTTPTLGEIEFGSLLAEDVVSASFVSTPALVVEGEGQLPMGGLSAGGYYRRRNKDDDEDWRRREEEERRRRLRLAEIIDRAIARVQAQLEPPSEAETPLPVAEIKAIDDALEAIQDRVQAIEDLGSRILEADAELKALRLEAIELIREAELDDDDEALELLLAA